VEKLAGLLRSAVRADSAGAARVIYRAYVLTFEGAVIRYQDFDCETDDEAVWLAQEPLFVSCTRRVLVGKEGLEPSKP
jgi:hypothetical protein